MKKLIFSLLIIAALALSAFAFSACDEAGEVYTVILKPTAGLYYEPTEDGAGYIVTYIAEEADKNVVIPATYMRDFARSN